MTTFFEAPYLVFGHPIAHSKSPMIHALFAKYTKIHHDYGKHLVPLDEFELTIQHFFAGIGKGANVTVPFKEEAYRLADALTDNANAAGAVNTLIKTADGHIIGDNTDGLGLLMDLQDRGWVKSEGRVLLLGAGGAARGAILPLLEAGFHITLCNRTFSKALALVDHFTTHFAHTPFSGRLRAVHTHMLNSEPQPFSLIINATAASITGEVPMIPTSSFTEQTAIYDMFYTKGQTAFLTWFEQQGCQNLADGLGMLVYQAAYAFERWHQVMPNAKQVLEEVRAMLLEQ